MSTSAPFDLSTTEVRAPVRTRALSWAVLSLLVAVIGVAGSLALSIWLDLKACPLCFYQRTFMMGVVGVLAIGLLADRSRAGLLCVVSLPLVFGGFGIALFHESLVLRGTLLCPVGISSKLGLSLTAPAESLLVFSVLLMTTLLGAWSARREIALGSLGVPLTALLGALLAYGCISSSTPPSAAAPEGTPLLGCRLAK